MLLWKKHLIIIIVLTIFQLAFIDKAEADELTHNNIAVSLVIDSSGSMSSTDPNRLRETAAHIFIDLLSPKDYLGIITFNSDVDLVVPMEQISNGQGRESLKELLSSRLSSTAGNTDYKEALELANRQLKDLNEDNVQKVVVFLTDGEPMPEYSLRNNMEFMNHYMEEMWSVVSELAQNGFPVYSIGFSDVNPEVLDRIATETKGDVRILKDPSELTLNFIQVLGQLKNRKGFVILPSISTDFWISDEGYRTSEEVTMTASMSIAGNRLFASDDLLVNGFNILISYEDGTIENIPLYDNGDNEYGDVKKGDGIFSGKYTFSIAGKAQATIVVSGDYKKEPFVLEKDLGEFIVDKPGNIIIDYDTHNIWTKAGELISITVNINNRSSFKEVLLINYNEDIGKVNTNKIELQPNSSTTMKLDILLNTELTESLHKFDIEIDPQHSLTSINKDKINLEIEILSNFQHLIRKLNDRRILIISLLIAFIGAPLLIILLGLLIYAVLIKPETTLKGVLTYWKKYDNDAISSGEIKLNKVKKKALTISFNTMSKADYYLDDEDFNYDIIIEIINTKKESAWIRGWRALFTGKLDVEILARCTLPGIIIKDEEIFTQLVLSDKDEFCTGNYCFSFSSSRVTWVKDRRAGKDILEGKI